MSDVESWKFEPVVAFGTPSDNVRETSKQIGSELQAYYDRLLWLPLPQEPAFSPPVNDDAARMPVATIRAAPAARKPVLRGGFLVAFR
jgi:hypothetical protein